jgi:hypothetical protein
MEQHSKLGRFIEGPRSKRPQVLEPVGAIKSGTCTLLRKVLFPPSSSAQRQVCALLRAG